VYHVLCNSVFSICVSYSGISALRYFGLSQSSSFRSDPAIGTALRRARGASCIRLLALTLIDDDLNFKLKSQGV